MVKKKQKKKNEEIITEESSEDNTEDDDTEDDNGKKRKKTKKKEKYFVSKGRLHIRCIPNAYHKFVKEVKLTEAEEDMIRRTPFGHFLGMSKSGVNVLVDTLVGDYLGEGSFRVNVKKMDFMKESFVEITRLPSGSDDIACENVEEDTHETEKFLPDMDSITRWKIKDAFKTVEKNRGAYSADIYVKLWILFVLADYVVPDSNCAIPKGLFAYVEKLDEISKYDWATYAYDLLLSRMERCQDRVWYYENMPTCIPHDASARPLFKKWLNPKIKKIKQNKIKGFDGASTNGKNENENHKKEYNEMEKELNKIKLQNAKLREENSTLKKGEQKVDKWEVELQKELNDAKEKLKMVQKYADDLQVENISLIEVVDGLKEKLKEKENDYEELKKNLDNQSVDYLHEYWDGQYKSEYEEDPPNNAKATQS